MKKVLIPVLLVALFAAGYVYYTSKQVPEVPVASAPIQQEVVEEVISGEVDTNINGEFEVVQGSLLGWKATKPTGFHTGDLMVTTGSLNVQSGVVIGGEFVLDMTSITLKDTDNERLLNEIKEDIFSASMYPTSTFVITSVVTTATGMIINGDLTITDQTHPISFPAMLDASEQQVNLQAEFAIDRRIWGLTAFEGIANDYIEYSVDLNFVATPVVDSETVVATGTSN